MVFSSSTFLFAFMPLFFAVYFVTPWRKARNVWLLVASLFFYAWGEPVYVLLMVASILANWLFGLALGRVGERKLAPTGQPEGLGTDVGAEQPESPDRRGELPLARRRKALLALAVAFDVAVIGFFKYEGFVATNVNALLGAAVAPNLELPLPIGISFYTLQALSYVIDVYRGQVPAQKNVLYLGMYVACFPQLIAGPIVRYQTIQGQVLGRKETLSDFADGMRLFVVGLTKKALLANTCAILATKMLEMGGPQIGAAGAWAGLIAYTFQIYFDFAGYSDMAIGLGRMMGFSYLRNFNYPYISRSITEFWRRWHISLSTFFRDYVYIPLGGSRCSVRRNIFNIAVVWAITGLWHGAAWNYVLWGVYYGVLLILEKFIWGKALGKAPALVGHVYTIAVFVFGWSFFWITDAHALFQFWKAMAGGYGWTGTSTFWELTAWEYWPVFIICAIAATPVCPFLKERLTAWAEGRGPVKVREAGIASPRRLDTPTLCMMECEPASKARGRTFAATAVLVDVALIALLLASCASVVSGSFNPFIYFQF